MARLIKNFNVTRINNTDKFFQSSLSSQLLYSKCMCSLTGNKDLKLNENFVNRNPRNMEMLRLQRKPKGYHLDAPTKNYWYRLEYELSNNSVSGRVVHFTGRNVVSANAKEPYIMNKLYKCGDASAAQNVGRILAQRCLQSGITEVHTELKKQEGSSERIKLFLSALEEGGVKLEEPLQILEEETYPHCPKRPTMPWEVSEEEALDSSLDRDPETMFKLPEGKKYW